MPWFITDVYHIILILLNETYILNIKNPDHSWIINGTRKSEAIKLLKNVNSTDKSGIL